MATQPKQPRGVLINTTLLRVLYQERGFSQRTLADAVGVQLQTIHRWLFGKTRPGVDTYKKLCEVLEVSPNLLEMSTAELMERGRHARVARFYLKEIIGENDAPTYRETQLILDDLQDATDRDASAEEVKPGEITIFGAEDAAPDTEPDPADGDAESGT